MNLQSLPKTSQLLAIVGNFIFLCYLLVFAFAQPTVPLVAAVCFETAFFVGMLAYRHWRSKSKGAIEAKAALASIEDNHKSIYLLRRGFAAVSVLFMGATCLYLTVDFCALLLATNGKSEASEPIYLAIAPPPAPDIHPALSMELLAGAYIEAGKLDQARDHFFLSLLDIRQRVAGEKSELVAAMYANLGDYYRKARNYPAAETFYVRSIDLSKELHLAQGYGSPMTKLGSLLREEHRYAKSEKAFCDALQVRQKIFGPNSSKVAETLGAYVGLLEDERRFDEAKNFKQRIESIEHMHQSNKHLTIVNLIPFIVAGTSLLLICLRNRILLFAAKKLGKQAKPEPQIDRDNSQARAA